MMRYRISGLVSFLLMVIVGQASFAQELDCRVIIDATQAESTERGVFTEMEDEFSRFMNDRTWTNDDFLNQERIKCGIMILLKAQNDGSNYSASVQIISVRPVFNTAYESSILNFGDTDFDFDYKQSQTLNYADNSFTSNITSLLAYYAYMILAFDYDTFGELGGEQYYEKARQVVTTAQQSRYKGWDQFSDIVSRYWLSQNSLDRLMKPYREAMYQYHRLGLDVLAEKPEEGRKNILEALAKIDQVNKAKPRSVIIINFMDTKLDELTNIFSEGDLAERREAYDLLKSISPSRTEDFKKILTN